MREFFVKLFSKGSSEIEITLFSGWHIGYVLLIVGLTIGAAFALNNKSEKAKTMTTNILAIAVIGLYIADFFIMPLTHGNAGLQGEISIDKLPFHICTLVGVFVPFAQFCKKFAPVKDVIACFAIVAPLMYITYPGTALGELQPWCYKVVQTFLFHGVEFAWGALVVSTKAVNLDFKKIWKEAVGTVIIIVWAFFGNYLFTNPEHHYDWFFVTGSTFPFIPAWLMPFVVFAAFFGMCAIIHLIDFAVKKIIQKRQLKNLSAS